LLRDKLFSLHATKTWACYTLSYKSTEGLTLKQVTVGNPKLYKPQDRETVINFNPKLIQAPGSEV